MTPDNYPKSLVQALYQYGCTPTGCIEWDKALLDTLKNRDKHNYAAFKSLDKSMRQLIEDSQSQPAKRLDMANPSVFNAQFAFWKQVADNILKPQRRTFTIDHLNQDVIRFLLYYFHGSPLAEKVFPDRGYKIHKNILIQGKAGAGKTLIMQIFSDYLRRINSPLAFQCISVTQMVNHFSLYNNIDLYTYNEAGSPGFQIHPYHLCLNDIGLENRPFYGISTNTVINDFLHARNELWSNQCDSDKCFAHLTTNLNTEELRRVFGAEDIYGRTIDRFKTYNVIPLPGDSRR